MDSRFFGCEWFGRGFSEPFQFPFCGYSMTFKRCQTAPKLLATQLRMLHCRTNSVQVPTAKSSFSRIDSSTVFFTQRGLSSDSYSSRVVGRLSSFPIEMATSSCFELPDRRHDSSSSGMPRSTGSRKPIQSLIALFTALVVFSQPCEARRSLNQGGIPFSPYFELCVLMLATR